MSQLIRFVPSFLVLVGILFATGSCTSDSKPTGNSTSGGGFIVSCGGVIYNGVDPLDAQPSITRCELLFDGKVIATVSSSTPVVSAEPFGVVQSVKRGRHTIAFKISGQSSSPRLYTTTAVLVLTDGNSIYQLPDKTSELRTGEAIEYTLDL